MISFVWSAKWPFWAGAGGSENYTAGQIRELKRRGIDCRIITIGHGDEDGRADFPDIDFVSLKSPKELETLDDTIVFVIYPLKVRTKNQSYVIAHIPPPTFTQPDPLWAERMKAISDKKVIATSSMAAGMWSRYLKFRQGLVSVVYPFAEQDFAKVERAVKTDDTIRILFAGRLTPDKGIYTLLAALHMDQLKNRKYGVTVTSAGQHTEHGDVLAPMLKANPHINFVPARKNSSGMARLMAEHDIVVMPTTNIFWKETFGIVSVEGQHAGCRVVASRAGGLPETNCGSLLLVNPDDPLALAKGLSKAADLGPVSTSQRLRATKYFSVEKSVDSLLKVIHYPKNQVSRVEIKRPHAPAMRLSGLSSRH